MTLSPPHREALLLVVACSCAIPGIWMALPAQEPAASVEIGEDLLTLLCDDLVEMGLLLDVGCDFRAMYRPTVEGVRQAIQHLQVFVASPPQSVEKLDG
jgi:hypothetical protein